MFLMIITFFQKNLICLQYHEIAGLVLIACVMLHIAINIKIISAMCKNFIKIPLETKVGVIIDVLLLICFAWIGISGVFISRTILTEISSSNVIFKLGHLFAGGLSVILLGIHIGLHVCRKPLPTIAAILISITVLCGGIYGMVNSNEVRWLTMPFTTVSQANGAEVHGSIELSKQHNSNIQNDNSRNSGKQTQMQSRNGQGKHAGNKGLSSLSVMQKFENILMFLFMILSFAVITYWISVFHKLLKCTNTPKA